MNNEPVIVLSVPFTPATTSTGACDTLSPSFSPPAPPCVSLTLQFDVDFLSRLFCGTQLTTYSLMALHLDQPAAHVLHSCVLATPGEFKVEAHL